jgi:hypothetical protein
MLNSATGVWVQSRATSYAIRDLRSGTGTGYSASVFRFSLLIIILSLYHTLLSPPPGISYIPD